MRLVRSHQTLSGGHELVMFVGCFIPLALEAFGRNILDGNGDTSADGRVWHTGNVGNGCIGWCEYNRIEFDERNILLIELHFIFEDETVVPNGDFAGDGESFKNKGEGD